MKRLKDALGDAVEKMVDRATEAGNPPPAHFVVKMKELGLLRPDNERPITRETLEEDDDDERTQPRDE